MVKKPEPEVEQFTKLKRELRSLEESLKTAQDLVKNNRKMRKQVIQRIKQLEKKYPQ